MFLRRLPTYCFLCNKKNAIKVSVSFSQSIFKRKSSSNSENDPELKRMINEMYKDFGISEKESSSQLNKSLPNKILMENNPETNQLIQEMQRDFGMSPEETIKQLKESKGKTHFLYFFCITSFINLFYRKRTFR